MSTDSLRIQLEVARARRLYQHPEVALAISPKLTVQIAGHGNRAFTTPVVKETTDPFFNQLFDITIPATMEASGCSVPSVQFRFDVEDCTNEDVPKLLGYGSFGISTTQNITKKEERVVDVEPPAELPPSDPEQPSSFGSVVFRYRVTIPKPKVVDVNLDVELNFTPKFSAALELVPGNTIYVWWYLTQGNDWKSRFSRSLLDSFRDDKLDKKNPLKSVADIVLSRWKCKRSHQVFSKLRICGEKFIRAAKIEFTQEEELALKLQWKELGAVRAIQNGANRSRKVGEMVDKLWLHYCTDVHYDSTVTHVGFELRDKMQATKFQRPQYEILKSALLTLFVSGLTQAQGDAIAREDFDVDINCSPTAAVKEKERVESIVEKETAAAGELLVAARATIRETIPPPSAGFSDSGGNRVCTSPSALLFAAVIHEAADFWSETMADSEYVQLLQALAPAVTAAKMRAALSPGESPRGGARTPRLGSANASKRKSKGASRKKQ